MAVLVREALPTDIGSMFAVRATVEENRATRDELEAAGLTEDVVADALGSNLRAWVAEDNARIVGFSIADFARGCLWALFVVPEFQRRGLGTELLNRGLECLFANGFATVFLTTDASTSAYGFYRARLWVDVGRIPDGTTRLELTATDWKRSGAARPVGA